eukprot:7346160-Karenia_brevis.AAC.1
MQRLASLSAQKTAEAAGTQIATKLTQRWFANLWSTDTYTTTELPLIVKTWNIYSVLPQAIRASIRDAAPMFMSWGMLAIQSMLTQ